MERSNLVLQEFLILTKDQRIEVILHSYGVFLMTKLLAKTRNLNPDLACVAGLLHDISKVVDGVDDLTHAKLGAARAKAMLGDNKLFSGNEIAIIEQAIKHHMEKVALHTPYDELLKDADVLEKYLSQTTDDWTSIHGKRLASLPREFRGA